VPKWERKNCRQPGKRPLVPLLHWHFIVVLKPKSGNRARQSAARKPERNGLLFHEKSHKSPLLLASTSARYNAPMRVISVQSGSNGNCIYVESGGVRLLVDAGVSGAQAESRLAGHGVNIRDINAVLISHDHSDHSGSLGVFQRKFGLPVYVTPRTLLQAGRRKALGKLDMIEHFAAGAPLRFGPVTVETIPTPHDGVDGVAFVVDDGQRRLGILTDLGHVFRGLGSLIESLDALILESNYEPRMLACGGYPPHLKRRIRGPGGHLSNQEAAWLVAEAASARLRWLCLAHLSEENNTPQQAQRVHREILGDRLPLYLASRYEASPIFVV
jgi:phosphoribosyl 1,2-cyclic phosphodiesterase